MDDFWIFVFSFFAFFVIDRLIQKRFKFDDAETQRHFRWNFIHATANACVVLSHFDDVVGVYLDPITSMSGESDTTGTMVILALHIYHVVFFYRHLHPNEWVHHIVMVFIVLPIGHSVKPGKLLGHGAFWASGLPGGIDYVLLCLVDLKLIEKMTEKTLNVYIHTWIRAPFCLFHSLLVWITFVEWQKSHPLLLDNTMWLLYICATFLTIVSYYWNSMFYCERVIRSHNNHSNLLLKSASNSQINQIHHID